MERAIDKDEIIIPYDSMCACKDCSHDMAKDCITTGCNCCNVENHSMILDGIEGFQKEPAQGR